MSSPAAGRAFNDYRLETGKGKKRSNPEHGRLSGGAGVRRRSLVGKPACQGYPHWGNARRPTRKNVRSPPIAVDT